MRYVYITYIYIYIYMHIWPFELEPGGLGRAAHFDILRLGIWGLSRGVGESFAGSLYGVKGNNTQS